MPEKVLLYGRGSPLVGVLTTPDAGPDPGLPGIVLLNAGILHRVGPNRLHVRLARRLAEAGYATVRFDLAGVGDSPPREDGLGLREGVARDVGETLDLLGQSHDLRRFVVAGLCAGADNALRAGCDDPRVVGLVLLDPTVWRTRGWYVRHYAPRLLRPGVWLRVLTGRHPAWRGLRDEALARLRPGEPTDETEPVAPPEMFQSGYLARHDMRDAFAAVVARRVRLFVTFTGSWSFIYNYRRQLRDCFHEVSFDDLLRLDYHPHTDHTFSREEDQRRLVESIVGWVRATPFEGTPDTP